MKDYIKYQLRMLAIILVFMFSCVILFSQNNTIYIATQPNRYIWDSGIGIGYEHQFKNVGGYMTVTKGKYSFADAGEVQQYKTSLGLTKITYKHHYYNFLLAGSINGSVLSGKTKIEIPEDAYNHISISLGCGAKIKRIAIIVTYDIRQKESNINFGYSFGR